MDRTQRAGIGFILMSVLGYSFLPVFTDRLLNAGLAPLDIAFWRFSFAAPLLWGIVFATGSGRGAPPLPRGRVLAVGMLFAPAALTAFYGLQRIEAGTYVVLFYTYPAMVALLGLLLGETLTGRGWLALGLTLAGVALTAPGFAEGLSGDAAAGVALALVNALVVAIYYILSSRVLRGYSGMANASAWALSGAWLAMAVITVVRLVTGDTVIVPSELSTWVTLVGLAVVSTVFPVFSLNNGIRRLGPAKAAIVGTIEPLVTAALAQVFIGQQMQPVQWLGGLVIIASVILLQSGGAARRRPVLAAAD